MATLYAAAHRASADFAAPRLPRLPDTPIRGPFRLCKKAKRMLALMLEVARLPAPTNFDRFIECFSCPARSTGRGSTVLRVSWFMDWLETEKQQVIVGQSL